MSKSKYPVETIQKCCTLYQTGESVANIVRECNVPRSTVYHWINQHRNITDIKDIHLRKQLDNLKQKHEKTMQIYEVLKQVNYTRHAPLQTRLYELEKLYGKYSVHVLCEALDVDRGTFYNHVLRNKKADTSYAKRRQELSKVVREIYEENRGLFGSDKILSILQARGYHTSKQMVRRLMSENSKSMYL